MKKILLSLLTFFTCHVSTAQCSLKQISLSERSNASDLIVEGKVIAKNSFWNAAHNMIYTSNTIEVYKVFKGNLNTTSIEILTMGGTVGFDRIKADPSLSLNIGDIGVFTCENVKRFNLTSLKKSSVPQYEAYASVQGFVKYDFTTRTASDPFRTYTNIETELYNSVLSSKLKTWKTVAQFDINNYVSSSQKKLQNPQTQSVAITSFSPSAITAGTASTLTINGSGFGSTQGSGTVGFKNADDGGASYINPLASQYISWNNTQIVVEVPSGAGTGTIQVTQGTTATSSSTLTVDYALQNVEFDPGSGTLAYPTDHTDDNGSGGYTWRMNPGFAANTAASDAFMRAFDTWRCNTGINWTIGSNTSVNDAVSDGTNVICFDNTAPLSAGILGVCYSYWSGCASGPSIVWFVNELDIIFDEGSNISPLTWQYGPSAPSSSQYDFESVAVHELGHGHQHGHVINPGAIMHYALSNGSFAHTPSATDLAGANYVQANSESANVCGQGAMTHYTCSSGIAPVADFSVSPTTICEGASITFADLSTNTPSSWSWTFTGGTPSSSSSQNPTVTYTVAGTYAVSLTATNSTGSDTKTISGYITVNDVPASTVSKTNVLCNGESTGSATVTASGGNGSYTYSWSPSGGSLATASNLSGGTYTCTITDGNSCAKTQTVTISEPSALAVAASGNSSVCIGSSVTLSATKTGGTGTVTYNWMPGSLSGSSVSVSPSATTTYSVTGTDANGCTAAATKQVTVSSSLTVTATSATVCSGNAGTITASGATSYSWNSGETTASITASPTVTTTYTVTGTSSGCTGTATGTITVHTCATAVTTVPCGKTYNKSTGSASAVAVTGAAQYKFTFYDNSTMALVAQTTQASRTLTFNTVAGLRFNKTYFWTVAVDLGNGFGQESSNSCTVTFSEPVTTIPCNVTYPNLSSYSACTAVIGAAGYCFTFYDNTTNAVVTSKTQTSNYIYFSQLPAGALRAGNTYKWTVKVQYNTGSSYVFGPESSASCPITFSAPATTVPCGITMASLNTYQACTAVSGAGKYLFKFYSPGTTTNPVASSLQTSNYVYFSQVTGLLNNNRYDWSVSIQYYNGTSYAWGPESTPCSITFGTPVAAINPEGSGSEQGSINKQEIAIEHDAIREFSAVLFPNPNKGNFSLDVNEDIFICIYNAVGEKVYQDAMQAGTKQFSLEELPAGIYLVQMSNGLTRKQLRLVKE